MDYKAKYKKALLDDCVPFWTKNSLDKINGGVYTSLDRQGQVYSQDKSVWMQGRCLYTYSALLNQFGPRPDWLAMAASCQHFLEQYCIDQDGRMFFSVTADGRPLRKRRYFFSEAFYVMGNATYALATSDPKALAAAREKYRFIRAIYDNPAHDPYKITPKSYATTRAVKSFAPTMILLNTAHIMLECDPAFSDEYMADAARFAAEFVNDFYHEELGQVLEHVAPDGSFISDNSTTRLVNPGHAIEGSWFLMNQARLTKDEQLMEKAIEIFDNSIQLGWDREYGGLFYFMDVLGKPVVELEADMKLWWPVTEALIASLMAYQASGAQSHWNWFTRLTDYAFNHFADQAAGEWFGYLHRDGSIAHTYKGSIFKGPFHVERALLLVYQMLAELV